MIVFASHPGGSPRLHLLPVTDNVSGNVPPIDGFAVATCSSGTLYVVDASAGKILALTPHGYRAGTVFVGEPKDHGNPLVGTLNLYNGQITPFGNHFVSPKGLLFVGGHCGDGHEDHEGDHGEGSDAPAPSHGSEGIRGATPANRPTS